MSTIIKHLSRLAAFGLVLLSMLATPAWSGEVQVAVASNFTAPMQRIASQFQRDTGHKAQLTFGASGRFFAQITNGAPFEVFLSADDVTPARLEAQGNAVAGSRFTYAVGRLVLYSTMPGVVDERGAVLRTGTFAHLSIADPTAAPYGLAAIQTMQKLKLCPVLLPKIVRGSSITQAYQFVATGAAELGFVAQSQVIKVPGGSRWLVPAKLHQPIDQQAILLRTGAANPAAAAFIKFLKGPEAVAIIKRYGYEVR